MTTFIAGASGATGRLLAAQLLERGQSVRMVVRSAESLPAPVRHHPNAVVNEASLLDFSDGDLADHLRGCDAVASCLGHNLTFRAFYGRPDYRG